MFRQCYRFIAHNTGCWLSSDSLRVHLPALRLPARKCWQCRLTPAADCASIPERAPASIVELLQPYQSDVSSEKLAELALAVDEEADPERVAEDIANLDAVSPDIFSRIEKKIRDALSLHPDRLVLPGESVGTIEVSQGQPDTDLIAGVSYSPCAILTELAAEAICSSGLHGCKIIPMDRRGLYSEPLHTMVVYGKGGVTRILSGTAEWRQCETCNEWWLWGQGPIRLALDEKQWDGSDFFHLAGKGPVYISRRAYEWLRTSRLRLLLDIDAIEELVFEASFPHDPVGPSPLPPLS